MKLNILYEDKHIIVVVKPSGILSQEDSTKDPDMLTLIKEYIKVNEEKEGNVFLGLVHRLDRMTSGIMVFAKRSKSASRLSEQIQKNEFKKSYIALVEGKVNESGTLKNYLLKNEQEVKSYVTSELNKLNLDCENIIGQSTIVYSGKEIELLRDFMSYGKMHFGRQYSLSTAFTYDGYLHIYQKILLYAEREFEKEKIDIAVKEVLKYSMKQCGESDKEFEQYIQTHTCPVCGCFFTSREVECVKCGFSIGKLNKNNKEDVFYN